MLQDDMQLLTGWNPLVVIDGLPLFPQPIFLVIEFTIFEVVALPPRSYVTVSPSEITFSVA
jgi:hypothetical protein